MAIPPGQASRDCRRSRIRQDTFRLKDPPLLMAEGQYKYNQDKTAKGLAGTVKLGAWYHFGKFDDEHFDVDGKSLADPSSNSVALTHSGDYGVYGVIDQMLWRLPGDDPKKGVGAFARASWILPMAI